VEFEGDAQSAYRRYFLRYADLLGAGELSAISYLEIKNQVGDGEGESPVLV